MASRIVTAARQAVTVSRKSSSHQPSLLLQRRGLAGAADHHGPPKVNCWQDPTSPSKWKEEHTREISFLPVPATVQVPPPKHGVELGYAVSMFDRLSPRFVIVSLSGWGLLIFGGYKLFSGGKGKEENVVEASH